MTSQHCHYIILGTLVRTMNSISVILFVAGVVTNCKYGSDHTTTKLISLQEKIFLLSKERADLITALTNKTEETCHLQKRLDQSTGLIMHLTNSLQAALKWIEQKVDMDAQRLQLYNNDIAISKDLQRNKISALQIRGNFGEVSLSVNIHPNCVTSATFKWQEVSTILKTMDFTNYVQLHFGLCQFPTNRDNLFHLESSTPTAAITTPNAKAKRNTAAIMVTLERDPSVKKIQPHNLYQYDLKPQNIHHILSVGWYSEDSQTFLILCDDVAMEMSVIVDRWGWTSICHEHSLLQNKFRSRSQEVYSLINWESSDICKYSEQFVDYNTVCEAALYVADIVLAKSYTPNLVT